MRPLPFAATLLAVPLAIFAEQPARSPRPGAPAAKEAEAALPVTRVALYKNGVGFFEHAGRVTGDAAVTIDLTSGQLNDVLQSLTAIDLNGGRISGAGYNSTTPLDQQLKTLPLALDDNPTAADFYAAIRGARVEVRSGGVAIVGRMLSVESREASAKGADSTGGNNVQRYYITVVSDAGDTRTVELTPATSVRLLDASLHNDVTRYLQLIDANRSQGLRHLTLADRGTGTRELRVSYISEVPVWKSTYRILFTNGGAGAQDATLQGWSVVDNTTGADWNDVQLSLIAGAPQSFIQPLSQPIYSRRPEIPIAQEAQLTPQTFDSALQSGPVAGVSGKVRDQTGASIPNASVVVTGADGSQQSASTDAQGNFSFSVPGGRYKVQVSAPGFQTVVQNAMANAGQLEVTLPVGSASETVEVSSGMGAPMAAKSVRMRAMGVAGGVTGGYAGLMGPPPPAAYAELAQASIAPDTKTAGFDDFFEYRINQPVTIRKNESALVPILLVKIPAEAVTLVSANGATISQPLRALWLTNNSGMTLDRGSFSIVEDGNFGGEGLLDPIHAEEKRLVSYAADQAVHVATENRTSNQHVTQITAAKGVLQLHHTVTQQVTYVVHNAASTARTVVLESRLNPPFAFDEDSKPDETTATVARYRLTVPAGGTVKRKIGEHHRNVTRYSLQSSNESQLTYILSQAENNPALVAALQPVLEARRKVADAQAAVDETSARLKSLREEEDRERANVTALKDADKSASGRFVRDLNDTEDKLRSAQAELDARTAALNAAKANLANAIESLQVDTGSGE